MNFWNLVIVHDFVIHFQEIKVYELLLHLVWDVGFDNIFKVFLIFVVEEDVKFMTEILIVGFVLFFCRIAKPILEDRQKLSKSCVRFLIIAPCNTLYYALDFCQIIYNLNLSWSDIFNCAGFTFSKQSNSTTLSITLWSI